MSSINPCFIIPIYNHALVFGRVIADLKKYEIPIIIINDGSDLETSNLLNEINEQNPDITLIQHSENQGKGGAVMTGLLFAEKQGYSHGFQIDADGQHDLSDIDEFLSSCEKNPEKIICGQPVYDDSIPTSRLISRYITHFWVWVETLCFQIKDSMCGFRIYPLKQSIEVIKQNNIGKRMNFDTEILVRLYWKGCELIFLPTSVIYPEDGVSHFKLVKDNCLITKMHTILFFQMLPKIPYLIRRNFQRTKPNTKPQHWGKRKEIGSLIGLKFLVRSYRVFGRKIFLLLLHPVIAFFTLFSVEPYKASKQYLEQLDKFTNKNQKIGWRQVYRHFYEFGVSAIDKISSWTGDFSEKDVKIHNSSLFDNIIDEQQGAIFIGSHLGNIELCRALGFQRHEKLKLNSLIYTKHAQKFQEVLNNNAHDFGVNLIDVSDFGVDTSLMLQDKVKKGEIIIIVGDRTSVTKSDRTHSVDFLGKKAPFAEGPFILASILNCPVYLLFCHKEDDIYNIYLEKFADTLKFPRATRNQLLAVKVQEYANRLTSYCVKSPYQWFNFYDFWGNNKTSKSNN